MNVSTLYPLYLESSSVVIDSRKVAKNSLLFAFSGENFNAATQAKAAIENGALAVIVEDPAFEDEERGIYLVDSTLKMLQDLALYHRDQLRIPIIGLTGSNGKTTTKELITSVLSEKFSVQSTVGNLNNHIGVPLTLLSIRPTHEMAVVEMGANHKKEIEFLCSLAKPSLGYITNFGKAHLEGFGGFQGVIEGKSELYDYLSKSGGNVLINESDPIQEEKTRNFPKRLTFGGNDSTYKFEPLEEGHFVGIGFEGREALSQLTGKYNFANLCAAASLGLHFSVSAEKIKSAIEKYAPSNMRSQVLEKASKTLVLDTYNANPSSMQVSLENFAKFEGSKAVILGDMLELGEESREEHRKILDLAIQLGFEEVFTVGPEFLAVGSKNAYASTSELKEYLKSHPVSSKNILLKGSRGIALESLQEVMD